MKVDIAKIVDKANLEAVREILQQLEELGPDEDTCLYLSFKTQPDDVLISEDIKKIYTDEITIVLQYQYHSLKLYDEHFTVNLSFNDIPQTIQVPFCYLTSFAETSTLVNFRLNSHLTEEANSTLAHLEEIAFEKDLFEKDDIEARPKDQRDETEPEENLGANVVSISRFRKKQD